MANTRKTYSPYENIQYDPFASDGITEFIHIQSVGQSGNYPDITVPSTGNYPATTLDRYFVYLPAIVDRSAITGARPMTLYDETSSTTLTRVASDPDANEYAIAPDDSLVRICVEVNSAQASHKLSYDYYSDGSIISKHYWGKRHFKDYLLMDTDYTVLNDDYYDSFIFNTTIQRTLTLPVASENIGRTIVVKNLTTRPNKITVSGGDGIRFPGHLGSAISDVFLFQQGDSITLLAMTSDWFIIDRNINICSGSIACSDWTNRMMGLCHFGYDNLSGSLVTGDTVTEATSGNTGIIIYYDVSTIYLYQITGTGLFTNNRQITLSSNGATCDVDEASGSSKNQESEVQHRMDIPFTVMRGIKFAFDEATYIPEHLWYDASYPAGISFVSITTNDSFIIRLALGGVLYIITGTGALGTINTQDSDFVFYLSI